MVLMPLSKGKDRITLCFKHIKLPAKNNRKPKLPFQISNICSKGAKDEKQVKKDKGTKKSSKWLVVKEEVDNNGRNDLGARCIPTGNRAGSTKLTKREEGGKKSNEKTSMGPGGQAGKPQICRVLSVRNGLDGAQVVAGWPTWLSSVAGEAIKGLIPRNVDAFEKLDKIGQGTYSSVYRARDLEIGKIVALKKVRFISMDPESVRFMAREILILRRLDHPNVMKLEGIVFSKVSGNLYLVFEYMEHDLSGLAAVVKFSEPQIKCFMQQLLRGLEHCHNRGVLHRDIKGSNLLIDGNGNLKIGDFGLANFFHTNQKHSLTSRVITLWYRPPELLLGASDYGVAVDLWSSGCILAELFVGRPTMPGRTEVEQLHKILKLCGSPSEEYWKNLKLTNATVFKPQQLYKRRVPETFKDLPASALSLLETLLAFEPGSRGTATSALKSEFFMTEPLPCDPSSLPKHPPSKELDVKMRNEEARRLRAAGGKGDGVKHSRKDSKDSRAVPAHHPNAERSSQKRKQPNAKSNYEFCNPDNDIGSGFLIEPSMQRLNARHSRLRCASGNSFHVDEGLHHRMWDSSIYRELNRQRSFKPQTEAVAAQLSGRDTSVHECWLERCPRARYELIDAPDSSHINGLIIRKGNHTGYTSKEGRMHYLGPLLPAGGSVEEMLKEHEKQIQNAVRKALADKKR